MKTTVWAKSILTSKTFRINVALFIVTAVDLAVAQSLPIVSEPWWPFVIIAVNIWLRKLTHQPVVVGPPQHVQVERTGP
jgi:hypothetical protein